MAYRKRHTIEKFWPIGRKGNKYVASASHSKTKGIPLLIVMRDILKLVKNKKELQKLINEKKVNVNGKTVIDVRLPVLLFDSISFPEIKKSYKAVLENKKIGFKEISDKEAGSRIYKVTNKKQLAKDKIQINLNDGRNILSSDKINVGDFVELDLANKKILKTISIDKGSEIIIIRGRHMGIIGKIKDIHEEGHTKIAVIEDDEGEVKVDVNNLFVLGAK
jgi:small subunit ribosomal protein S4e